MKKYNIKTIANTGVTVFVAGTIVLSPYLKKQTIPYTETDTANIPLYLEELKKIEEEYEIRFQNEELYNIIAQQLGENFKIEDLKNITTLTLDSLTNQDLSDLKYLSNLYELTIRHANVDLSSLKYNQKLERLNIHFSDITNSSELPNSVQLIELVAVDVKDNHLYMPYNTMALRMYRTLFSSFTLKNPKSLVQLEYDSYGILDLASLEECTNLRHLSITKSPNIKNHQVLTKLPSLNYLSLDNYAPIWLDQKTLNKIDCLNHTTKDNLTFWIDILDKLTNKIIPSKMSDKDKIKNISLAVAELIEYDKRTEGTDISEQLVEMYNEDPLTYALKEGKGVCMNYGCLFAALANRAGLDNYQDFSDNHTWNIINNNGEQSYYDITNMDKPYAIIRGKDNLPYGDPEMSYLEYFNYNAEDLLYYYNFTKEESTYQGLIPELLPNEEYNIGYVSSTFARTDMENLEIRRETFKKILPIYMLQLIANIILTINENNQTKRKVK